MPAQNQPLSDDIRDIADRATDDGVSGPLQTLATRVLELETLIVLLHDFVEDANQRADFEGGLCHSEQELYRNFFDLASDEDGEDEGDDRFDDEPEELSF